ncbi:MAG: methyl-accepting chemotaxis protein [Pseudomonadota bacterium]
MTKTTPYKRSQYFVKKQFQVSFILKFCLILLAGILLSTTLLFVFSQDTLTSSYTNSRLEIQSTGDAILPAVILTNLVTSGLISFFAIVVLLYISHKIAGPLFRFEKDIKRAASGDLTVQINLRKKDQLQSMAVVLNQMIQSMYTKVAYIDGKLAKIQSLEAEGKSVENEISRLRTQIQESFVFNK